MFTPITNPATTRRHPGQMLRWLGAFVILAAALGAATIIGFLL